VLELRGRGLLAGVKITPPVREVTARLRDEHHLLAMTAGDNVLRVLPPLIVTEAEIDEGVDRIESLFAAIEAETGADAKRTA
jgi:acetylornithine/N-succinyldiaminopimelate aminotransferase